MSVGSKLNPFQLSQDDLLFIFYLAATDLGLMESCDEFHRKSYCGSGLICHRCDDQSDSICVRCKYINQSEIKLKFVIKARIVKLGSTPFMNSPVCSPGN